MSADFGPKPTTLQGRHVLLTPLTLAHSADLLAAAADPEIWNYLPYQQPRTEPDMRALIESAERDQERGFSVAFAIVDLRSGKAIGSTRYLDIRPRDRGVEIGSTWLSSEVWRTAFNTECKYLLLRHAFEDLSALRVQLKTDERNQRSRAAILGIGATFEGILRCDRVLWNGFVRSSAYYSITHQEWPAVRARLEERLNRPAGV
ncbi:MAG TPA: GNAT family protein [Polyangiales bacterium]|nr:GNAT family protein [Polyangiales bacterium]